MEFSRRKLHNIELAVVGAVDLFDAKKLGNFPLEVSTADKVMRRQLGNSN